MRHQCGRLRRGGSLGDGLLQFGHAFARSGGQRHHGAAQFLRQQRGVYLHAFVGGHVGHVHRQQQWHLHFGKLGGEIKIALEVGSVHHVHHQMSGLLLGIAACHLLIQRYFLVGHIQRISAGQIHHFKSVAAQRIFAAHALYCYARPVAHALARAGEGVEYGGFAAIGVADQA